MRRHVLNALTTLAAATALTVGGCSSGASKPAAAPTASATTSASPAIDAGCLQGDPEAAKHVTHFEGGNGHQVEAYTTGTGPVGVVLAHQVGADLCQWSSIW